ncbi:MAG TPA: NUDIX hydrolase [Pyrinomonadaceae bacterium]|jgi:ADP-ribose pyrophosphatase|nr:NUDIX hydrolase [Pyrinomonadaceae bacterium]
MDTSDKEAPDVLASRDVYVGRIFTVSVDEVREGEVVYERDVVRHPGSAAIVAAHDDGTVSLVRQYRHPAVKYLLEIPAGSRNVEETPEESAARELEEELGLVADSLVKIVEFFVSPGFCAEKMWVYLATGLRDTRQQLEDDEVIEIVRLSWARLFEMIADNEIEDAKTIIGITLGAKYLGIAVPEEIGL